MGRSKLKGRAGLMCVLVFVLSISPALPVVAGRGLFFRRAVRSYGSTGAVAGSWGSHGASGGGRVTYTRVNTRSGGQAAQKGMTGSYASHGAAGGSPQNRVSSTRSIQPQYPGNRSVVRRPVQSSALQPTSTEVPRVKIPSGPVDCGIAENVSRTPSIAKRTTLPAPSKIVVPTAPEDGKLARAAYHADGGNQVAFDDLLPLQSIARLEIRRHILLKPDIDDPKDFAQQKLDSTASESPEPAVASRRIEAELQPKLDSDELVSAPKSVEKLTSPRKVVTTSEVPAIDESEEPSTSEEEAASDESELNSVLVNANEDSDEDSDEDSESKEGSDTTLDQSSADNTTQADESKPQPKSAGPQSKSAESQPKPAESPLQPQRARLVLNVPADAEVYLMGRRMVTTGETRLFNVPIGDPGRLHSYHIRVKSVEGHAIETTQWIRAGQRLELTIADESGRFAVSPPHVSVFE